MTKTKKVPVKKKPAQKKSKRITPIKPTKRIGDLLTGMKQDFGNPISPIDEIGPFGGLLGEYKEGTEHVAIPADNPTSRLLAFSLVEAGEPVVMDNPLNPSEKIYIDTAQPGMRLDTDNGKAIVTNPIVADRLPFEKWPEDAQRQEYESFMQKVKTYVDYWPASLEWPRFEDFLDLDVRTSAAAELNKWIANPVDPAKIQQVKKPAQLFERRKTEMAQYAGEAVNHPSHYGGDVWHEPIKVIKAWNLNFNTGSTVKYIARAGKKKPTLEGHIEDLKKAAFFLNDEIKHLESQLPK